MNYAFGIKSNNSWPSPKPQKFSPVFFPKHFIVFCLTVKPVIHLELIFVYDVRLKLRYFVCVCVSYKY